MCQTCSPRECQRQARLLRAGSRQVHVVQNALEQLQKVLNLARFCSVCQFPGRAVVMQKHHTVIAYCNARVNVAQLRGCSVSSNSCSQMYTFMNLTSSSTLVKTIAQRITSVTRSTCPRYERYTCHATSLCTHRERHKSKRFAFAS